MWEVQQQVSDVQPLHDAEPRLRYLPRQVHRQLPEGGHARLQRQVPVREVQLDVKGEDQDGAQ